MNNKMWQKEVQDTSLKLLKIIEHNQEMSGVEQIIEHIDLADEHLICCTKKLRRGSIRSNILLSKKWKQVNDSLQEIKERIDFINQRIESINGGNG